MPLSTIYTYSYIVVVSFIGGGNRRVPGENHWPVPSHWQTLSHNVVSSTPRLSELVFDGGDNSLECFSRDTQTMGCGSRFQQYFATTMHLKSGLIRWVAFGGSDHPIFPSA